MFLSGLILCVCLIVDQGTAVGFSSVKNVVHSKKTFRAAVYEHDVILPLFALLPVSRKKALENMKKNLDIFEKQAKIAASKGVDILVFPEDGIYGMVFARATIFPYLESIPNPKVVSWNPCNNPKRYPHTDVQNKLSCMAKNNKMYIVADMGDKQACNKTDPNCPKNGFYHYNTAVAYDTNGTFVARYHKTHLYKEGQFDTPKSTEFIYFDTWFGRVGLTICFDFLFKHPLVDLIEKYKISTMAMPTAWIDSLPLLSAIGYHSSISRGFGINVLAANIHRPQNRFQGSGIYTNYGTSSYYYNSTTGSSSKLLIQDLKIIKPANNKNNKKELMPYENIKQWNIGKLMTRLNDEIVHKKIYSQMSKFDSNGFTFVELDKYQGHNIAVKKGRSSCSLDYSYSRLNGTSDLLVLGVFDGMFHKKYDLQACVILKCPTNNKTSCGSYTFESNTLFSHFTLRATTQAKYFLPQVVLTKQNQLELTESWSFNGASNSGVIKAKNLSNPLLVAGVLSRDFL